MVEERVKALPDVKKPRIPFPQVPLTDVRGTVAGVIEEVRKVSPQVESRIREWIGNRFLVDVVRPVRHEGIRVFQHPVLVWILARKDRGATGAAQWLRGVAIVETDSGRGESINVRRVHVRTTICPDCVSAALVKKNEQEVRRALAATLFGSRRRLGQGPPGRGSAPEHSESP